MFKFTQKNWGDFKMAKKPAPKATPKKQAPSSKAPAKKPVAKNTKQTSDNVASLASRGLKNPDSLTPAEIKKICASNIAQSNPRDEK